MATDIDSLQIQINANATKANNALDKLAKQIDGLATSLKRVDSSGINSFSKSIENFASALQSINSVNTSGFANITKEISRLSSINTEGFEKISDGIQKMSNSVDGLRTENLDKAAKNVQKMNTVVKSTTAGMSKFEVFTQSINKAYSALGKINNLVDRAFSAFGKINSAVARATKGFLNFATGVGRANKETKSFVSTASKLVAKLYLMKKAFSALWGAVESSMDYIETLNYFDSAFGQVADKAVSQWSTSGYKSADAYYNSFAERAKQLTAKMSGFTVSSTGNLTSTGLPSLGIDPERVMNYQAMFAQMSSSMGIASETSLKLSNALTMIGADLASVKNMDFEDVWEDMASGLAGMSRTLDKYGVNIRNVNLQQKLTELGIEANISALNQNQKALLRTIILLDSTRYAWGDLAETINAPANQLRLLTSNLQNLARMIGNLFLPLVAKVLPYLNGIVIALQRLVTWIGSIFGIDLSNISSSIGSAGNSVGELVGDSEDLDDSLDDAADSAKKLKNNLLGIDELNILSQDVGTSLDDLTNSDIDIALDDAFLKTLEEYQKEWDKAFNNLENKANDIADKIVEKVKHAFEPISKAWAKEADFVIESWKNAFSSIKALVSDIGRDLSEVWHQEKTVKIFEDIFHILGDIGQIVANLADNFRKAWNENETGKKILENIRDIIGEIIHNIRLAADATVEWSKNLDFSPLLTSFEGLTRKIADNIGEVSGIFLDFYEDVLLKLSKWTIEKGLPELLDVLTAFVDKVDWSALRRNFKNLWNLLEPFAETVGEGLIIFFEKLTDELAYTINWISELDFSPLFNSLESLAETVGKHFENISGIFSDFYENVLLKFAKWAAESGIPAVIDVFRDFIDKIDWEKLRKNLNDLWESLEPFMETIGEGLIIFIERVTDGIANFVNSEKFENFLKFLEDWMDSVEPEDVADAIETLIKSIVAFKSAMLGLKALKSLTDVINIVKNFFGLFSKGGVAAEATVILKEISEVGGVSGISSAGASAAGASKAGTSALGALGTVGKGALGAVGAVLTATGLFELFDDEISEYQKQIGQNPIQVDAKHDEYEGWSGKLKALYDGSIGAWINGIKGLPAVGSNEVLSDDALEKAMDKIASGKIYSDKQMDKMQETWNLSDEDMEMLRQAMFDANPELREIADNTGMYDASIETLQKMLEKNESSGAPEWLKSALKFLSEQTIGAVAIGGNPSTSDGGSSSSLMSTEMWKNFEEEAISIWNRISESLTSIWSTISEKATTIWTGITTFFSGVWEGVQSVAETVWNYVSGFLSDTWEDIQETASEIWADIKETVIGIWDKAEEKAREAWEDITKLLSEKWSDIRTDATEKWDDIKSKVTDVWDNVQEKAETVWNEVAPYLAGKWSDIRTDATEKWDDIKEKLTNVWGNVKEETTNVWTSTTKLLTDKWGEIKKSAGELKDKIVELLANFSEDKWTLSGAISGITTSFGLVKSTVEKLWNEAADVINPKLKFDIPSLDLFGEHIFDATTIDLGEIPKFATGGFPEDGLFFANHNELVGQFGNGKTAVANNEQITEGIKQGVREAVSDILAPYLAEIAQNTKESASKDFDVKLDGRSVLEGLDRRSKRNGFSFS